MIDMPAMLDRLAEWGEFARQYWSFGPAPDAVWTAVILFLAGFVLAMWGARLLRASYVIGFMIVGASIGIRIAREHEVELLIGLVLGAGAASMLGYFLYRWWVGLTAGVVAAMVVAAVGAPWASQQAESFLDALLQQATGQRIFVSQAGDTVSGQPATVPELPVVTPEPTDLGGPAVDWSAIAATLMPVDGQPRPSPLACLRTWADALWAAIPDDLRNLGLAAGLAGLLGLALGVFLPKFTTIVGTSVIGTLAMAAAAATLICRNVPGLWHSIQAQPAWFYGAVALVLVVSLAFQVRRGKLRQIASGAKVAPVAG